MNDAGSNPDHIGQAVFVERIRGDIACYDALLIVSQIVRVVPRGGIEPPTPAFSVQCSTN
jgi:hypothetical protein